MSIFLMGTAWGNESAFETKILEVIFWKLGVHCKNFNYSGHSISHPERVQRKPGLKRAKSFISVSHEIV